MQDARRHQVEGELLAAVDHPVASVAAALVAHNEIRMGAELVNDFALALVAPLGSHDRHHTHRCAPFSMTVPHHPPCWT